MSQRQISKLEAAGAVAWPSFLAAATATMFFFAMFDPVRLGEIITLPFELSRPMGYTIGFFLFWLLTALSSYLTALLLLTRSASPVNEHE
jgi:hypothetical protein